MADSTKLPYHGTTLARFGDATQVTLGCPCGDSCDCDGAFICKCGGGEIQM